MKPTKLFLTGLLSLTLLIGCAATQNQSQPGTASQDSPETAKVHTESFTVDGLQVITKQTPGNPVVAVGFYLNGGTKYEPKNLAGIERMMFTIATHGTQSLSKDSLNAALESMGTNAGADAAYDYNGFTMTTLKRNFARSWALFTDMVLHPAFADAEVELVKEQQLNNLKSEKDDPDSYLRLVSNELYFDDHPYAVSLNGTEESVSGITRQQLLDYHAKNVTKSRALLVIVGDVSLDQVKTQVQALATELPRDPGEYSAELPAGFDAGVSDLKIIQRDLPTNYIRGLCTAPAPGTEDYPAFFAAMNILDDKLFEEIRTKRNLSYAPASGVSIRAQNYGVLYVSTVAPDTTVKVMFESIEEMQAEPLSEDELNDKITQTITRNLMQQETAAAQRNELARYELAGGGWSNSEMFIDKLMALKPEDLQKAMKQYAHNWHFAVIGDSTAVDEVLFTSK